MLVVRLILFCFSYAKNYGRGVLIFLTDNVDLNECGSHLMIEYFSSKGI